MSARPTMRTPTPGRPVTVASTSNEAVAVFNVLSTMISQPDTARDLFMIFTTNEMRAVGRYAGRLANELHVQPPRDPR